MSISTIRHGEPLYLVIMRDPRASTLFREWVAENRVKHVQIQDNKLQLFDYHSVNVFVMTWKGEWSNLVIWDAWNRRHVNL
jgi:hypothetical protein